MKKNAELSELHKIIENHSLQYHKMINERNDRLEAEVKKLKDENEDAHYIIASIGPNTSCEMQSKIAYWLEAREALR